MTAVRVGLLGLGNVGCGTVNVLSRNRQEIARRAGRAIEVVHAGVRHLDRPRQCATKSIVLTSDPQAVVDSPEVEIVVELLGGIEPARTLVLRAIELGKPVVTANKALIALHGNELFATARRRGVMVAFEAAVAGGIPIIKAIRESLAGNRIEWLAGIINGTANFILSEMLARSRPFAEVLTEAQQLGYAEADPRYDVEGIDAAHKLAILAAIAFGKPLQFERVYIEGIAAVAPEDISYAGQLGYRIKHLGFARRTAQGVEMRVHPTLIPRRRLIANVNGVMNAVLVKGDAVGPTLYYGAGAGAEPTASSVVADLVDVVRTMTSDPDQRVPHLAFQPQAISALPILPMEEIETAYYLRMRALDRPGVLADVARILGDHGISIEAVVQKEPMAGEEWVPLIMLTHRIREGRMTAALEAIAGLDGIQGQVTRIRVEQLSGD